MSALKTTNRSKRRIRLTQWASRLDPMPTENTLRRWCREGKIYPNPVKIGRTYFVDLDAMHIAEVLNGAVS